MGRIEEALRPPPKGSKGKKGAPYGARRRLIDLRMRSEVCQGLLGTCEDSEDGDEAEGGDDDDDDDDDEDDEREL